MTVSPTARREVTYYQIQVGQVVPGGSEPLVLNKRFSDFDELRGAQPKR